MAGARGAPSGTQNQVQDDDPRNVALVRMTRTEGYFPYYEAIVGLTDFELRRLWIAEGKRRGYELS